MDETLQRLAEALGIEPTTLNKHLMRPIPPPAKRAVALLADWGAPEELRRLHALSDSFKLFGNDPWDGFTLLNAQDYEELRKDCIFEASKRIGVVPIWGNVPHLTSVRLSDGAVVSTDWEGEGDPGSAWLEPIAPSIAEYVSTVIQVCEAYGSSGDPSDMPADWWGPYASHGSRYDLEP